MLGLVTIPTLVLLTLFLPGFFSFDLFFSRVRRDALEVFFLRVVLSVLLTSGVALLMADCGLFSVPRVLGVLALVSCAGAAWARMRQRTPGGAAPVLGREERVLGLLLAGAAWVFAQPHEYLYGGWDPGVYLQTAAHIAATGGINFHDALLAGMDPAARDLVLAHKGLPELMSGFRLVSVDGGLISPQFQHLYSCWVALFHGVGGLPLALRVNALFAVLSVLAFYLAGRALFDGRTGLLAAALLAGNVVQIWFARFSTAEIVTQYFVWSGLYLLALHWRGEGDRSGVVGAGCLGAAWMTHISAWYLAVPLLAVMLYRVASGTLKRDLPVLLALVACGALAILQNQFVSLGYLSLIQHARWVVFRHPEWIVAALVLAVCLCGFGRGDSGRVDRLLGRAWVRAGLVLAILGLALYAVVFRPHVVAASPAAAALEGDRLKRLLGNALSVRDLARLFTPLGLGLGVAGAAWMAWRGLTRVRAPVLVILLTVSIAVLHDRHVEPFYMFGARRFLIVVIPAVCLCLAYGLALLWERPWRAAKPAVLACLALVLLVPAVLGRNVVMIRDYRGLAAFCRQVADLLPAGRDRRVLLCDDERWAAPLRFVHGENAFAIRVPGGRDIAPLTRQIELWQKEGREVFYLSERNPPLALGRALSEAGRAHFESARLERSPRFFPVERVRHEASPVLFRVQPLL